MGIVAFCVDVLEENLVFWKWRITQSLLNTKGVAVAWLMFLFLSVLFGGLSALLTVFVGPGAMGSGIAELMGYFNGVQIP